VTTTRMFAEIAALAGDPARARMLHAMLDGRAMTASELAWVAGIAPQTASGHLARMTTVGLVSVEKQGRHRYHRLASPAVARMMEGIMQVASDLAPHRKYATNGPRDAAFRAARVCYDHLAGQLGVALADALVKAGYAELSAEGGIFTDKGLEFLRRIGIQTGGFVTANGGPSKRALCRPCLDWTERRLHLGGAIGAAICSHCFDKGWIRRIEDSRAVSITPSGRLFFRKQFGPELT
jgi:DNA-binding transcriptional ArsR family regulator